MSYSNPRNPNPTDTLYKALNTTIQVRVKRNQTISGQLKSFDAHMNILLENVTYTYGVPDETNEGKYKNIGEDFPSVVIRGDNIVFIEYNPVN